MTTRRLQRPATSRSLRVAQQVANHLGPAITAHTLGKATAANRAAQSHAQATRVLTRQVTHAAGDLTQRRNR